MIALSISDILMRAITLLQFLYDKWSLRHAHAVCQRWICARSECFLRPLKHGLMCQNGVFNVVLSLHESKATCFGENRGFYKNVSQVEVNVVTRKHHCSLQIHMAV